MSGLYLLWCGVYQKVGCLFGHPDANQPRDSASLDLADNGHTAEVTSDDQLWQKPRNSKGVDKIHRGLQYPG